MTGYYFQIAKFLLPELRKVEIHSVASCEHAPMEAEIPLQAQLPIPHYFHCPPQRNAFMSCVLETPSLPHKTLTTQLKTGNRTTLNSASQTNLY